MRFSVPMIALLSFVSPAVAEETQTAEAAKPVDFAHEILPLIKARCAKCHTAGTYKGDVSMDTRPALIKSKAVVPGDAAKSDLIARVTSTEADQRMPPIGDPLTAEQVALLTRWIDQGVTWQDGFSLGKQKTATAPLELKRPAIPPSREG